MTPICRPGVRACVCLSTKVVDEKKFFCCSLFASSGVGCVLGIHYRQQQRMQRCVNNKLCIWQFPGKGRGKVWWWEATTKLKLPANCNSSRGWDQAGLDDGGCLVSTGCRILLMNAVPQITKKWRTVQNSIVSSHSHCFYRLFFQSCIMSSIRCF